MIDNLLLGFTVALSVQNIIYCLIGVTLGLLVGILPGLGPAATLAILLPYAHIGNPISSIIMMAGIYYGSQYGGSITAILLKLPGEASAVPSMLDGNAMAKKGYAGAALGIAGIASFIGGCFATICIAYFAPLLMDFALKFGAREYLALLFFAVFCVVLTHTESLIKGLILLCMGMMLGMIGTDVGSGHVRYNFGFLELNSGISFITPIMALYGITEILFHFSQKQELKNIVVKQQHIFSKKSIKLMLVSWKSILRGSVIGSFMGLMPGGGGALGSFVAYAIEKKIALKKVLFGKGDIRGVAGPEAANNAAAQTSFIPMLSLGFPINTVMVLIMTAIMIQGITIGPSTAKNNVELFWGMIASMYIGNLMLLWMSLAMIPFFIKIVNIPRTAIYIVVFLCCIYGAYSINYNLFDIYLMIFLGCIGFFLKKARYEFTPLILGFIIGPKLEDNLRSFMHINNGNVYKLFQSNISLVFYVFILVIILYILRKKIKEL